MFQLNKKCNSVIFTKNSNKNFDFSVIEPQSYNPGKTNYDPNNDACWKTGEE
jgi:hypothetical protein